MEQIDPHPGESRLGRYRIFEQLGAGGMAVVHRVLLDGPEGFARTAVMKRVLPWLARDREFVAMFLAEARLSARLHHPNIVQIYDCGELDGTYFLVMEHIDGLNLARLLSRCRQQRRAMSPGLVCHLVREVVAALAHAHALRGDDGACLGITHRDVSPSNIMIGAAGSVKLLDFGIAKATASITDDTMRLGTRSGKLGYLAPEQASGGTIDARSDLFALGLVMRECLTLAPVYPAGDPSRTLALARRAEVASLACELPGLDPQIGAVVDRLLARDPALRFQRADEVEAALTPIVRRLQADAAGLRAFVETALRDEDTATHRLVTPPTSLRRPSPSRPWLPLVAASLLIVVAGIALSAPSAPAGTSTPAAPPPRAEAPVPTSALQAPPPPPSRVAPTTSRVHKQRSRSAPAPASRRPRPFDPEDDRPIVSGPDLRNPFAR